MKKDKPFDAVRLMREIRDRMSKEMLGMTPKEQLEYYAKKARLRGAGTEPDASGTDDG